MHVWELINGMVDKRFCLTVSLSHGRVALLKNCPMCLLPYTHEAEPQMYGYYRGWLYNAGTFHPAFRRESTHDYTIAISIGLTRS